jgi:hypothetical protein
MSAESLEETKEPLTPFRVVKSGIKEESSPVFLCDPIGIQPEEEVD